MIPQTHPKMTLSLVFTIISLLLLLHHSQALEEVPIVETPHKGPSNGFHSHPHSHSHQYIVPPKTSLKASTYAQWAHSHWVWLEHNYESQHALTELVKNYQSFDIPVGAINVDSGWSTGYNNFIWDTKKFPDAKGMIDSMHQKDIKVIAWATSMINEDSSNFAEGKQKGYYLNDGKLLKWWHGHGAFIDYTNPDALEWWHKQMDVALDTGLDGWKTDGTDPYVFLYGIIHAHKGVISERHYANDYYRDFLYYTREKRGPHALLMARPADSFSIPGVFDLFLDFAPQDCLVSGWVGDQDPTFDGLKHALRNMFRSAEKKYANYGSDTGGYRGFHWPNGTDPRVVQCGRSKELFLRWAQLSCFNSLFENGGNGVHEPWVFDQVYKTNDTVPIYRYFVHMHMELGPYLYSAGTEALEKGVAVMKPLAWSAEFPSTYNFLLWKDIFVAPMVQEGTTQRNIYFPKGDDWVDWWNPSQIFKGGQHLDVYDTPLDRFPVFKRKGSILPLNVTSDYTSLHGANANHRNHLTLSVLYPTRKSVRKSAQVRFMEGHGIEAAYKYLENGLELTATGHDSLAMDLVYVIEGLHVNRAQFAVHRFSLSNQQQRVRSVEDENDLWNSCKEEEETCLFVDPSVAHGLIKIRVKNTAAGVRLHLSGVEEV